MLRRRRAVPLAEWGTEVHTFDLPTDGAVQYARWRHPGETPKVIAQDEVDGLRIFLKPGDFAIDIGAHTGDTTVPMALAAGKFGCVLALEPNPHVYKVLELNASFNCERTNIVPRCVASTREDGSFVFHYGDASYCNGGFRSQQRWKFFRRKYPLTVTGRNLHRLLHTEYSQWLPKLTYVKVDAEGYDRVILESILPVLSELRPVIRAEVFRKLMVSERYALFDMLASLGYQVHRFNGGAEPRGVLLSRRNMTAGKHFDVLAVPRLSCSRNTGRAPNRRPPPSSHTSHCPSTKSGNCSTPINVQLLRLAKSWAAPVKRRLRITALRSQ